jgi:hypothetical protein
MLLTQKSEDRSHGAGEEKSIDMLSDVNIVVNFLLLKLTESVDDRGVLRRSCADTADSYAEKNKTYRTILPGAISRSGCKRMG